MKTLTLSTVEARDRGVLRAMLCEIGEAEYRARRPLLTSIVVHKSGDMEPGPCFYELGQRLGLPINEQQQFWLQQMKATHAYWSAAH